MSIQKKAAQVVQVQVVQVQVVQVVRVPVVRMIVQYKHLFGTRRTSVVMTAHFGSTLDTTRITLMENAQRSAKVIGCWKSELLAMLIVAVPVARVQAALVQVVLVQT